MDVYNFICAWVRTGLMDVLTPLCQPLSSQRLHLLPRSMLSALSVPRNFLSLITSLSVSPSEFRGPNLPRSRIHREFPGPLSYRPSHGAFVNVQR